MYFVVHHDDYFGKLMNPKVLFGYMGSLKFFSWSTLVIETVAPFLIWFSHGGLKKIVLVTLFLFHLGIDLTMNLEFFHWIMILGWASFLIEPIQRTELALGVE